MVIIYDPNMFFICAPVVRLLRPAAQKEEKSKRWFAQSATADLNDPIVLTDNVLGNR